MRSKPPLFAVFFTVFIDMVGVGIVIPIFASIFIRPDAGILAVGASESTRTMYLGLLIATYPLAQFFGAPLLGALSDRYGRKKILLVSLVGTVLGYLFFGYGIVAKSIVILFASRMLDGFTGGNISIAMSAIADLSDPKDKARNFGLVGMAFGLGFIVGPALGGLLSDSSIVSWFTYATPFWVAAALSVINIILVLIQFPETLTARSHAPISVFTGFKNLRNAMKLVNLRTLFIVVFLLTFGFNFFTQFFQVYLIQTFSYSQSQIGTIFAYVGVWIAVVQGALIRPLSRRFQPAEILSYSALLLGCTLPLLLLPTQAWVLYCILPFVAIFNGLTFPNANAMISNLADERSQGEILGINQSIQALGMALPPLIAGFIVTIDKHLPILVAGGTTILAWSIFMVAYRLKNRQPFHG